MEGIKYKKGQISMFLLNTKCSYLLLLQWTIEKYINLLELEQIIKYNSDGLYATAMIEIRLDKNYNTLLNLPPQTLL